MSSRCSGVISIGIGCLPSSLSPTAADVNYIVNGLNATRRSAGMDERP